MKPFRANRPPTGKRAARAFSLERTWERKSAHSSHSRTWRRTGPETLRRPSAASESSTRTSPQVSRRAWLASASEIRARTSSDLTEGTRGLHRRGDLLVGEGVHLAQQQGRALGLGKFLDVDEELAELLAVVDLLGGRGGLDGGHHVHRFLRVGGRFAQVVEAAVAGDPVEPGAQVDLALVAQHRFVGVDEDLLQHVLGVLGGAEHLPAEAEQATLVAVDDRLEGAGVAAARHRDQLRVALQLEQGRAAGQESAATGVR